MAPQARNFGDFRGCYRVTAFLNVSQRFSIVSHMLPRGDTLASSVLYHGISTGFRVLAGQGVCSYPPTVTKGTYLPIRTGFQNLQMP